jgi:hypothetical protein
MLNVGANAQGIASIGAADAVARVRDAISQSADGSSALAKIVNGGKINIAAIALATGISDASAFAAANGIRQNADNGIASLVNDGSIAIGASAAAHVGDVGNGSAFAELGLRAVTQEANGVGATLDNHGSIAISGIGRADGPGSAFAGASIVGIEQHVTGTGASVSNTGALAIAAMAEAKGETRADADARVSDAVFQEVLGKGSASASLDNSGTLTVAANAQGVALLGAAKAQASVGAVSQSASGSSPIARIANGGKINVVAVAQATGQSAASAFAAADGARQTLDSGTASLSNAGILAVQATASAAAKNGPANATAVVHGLQSSGSKAALDNSGTLSATGKAETVSGMDGFASAVADGYEARNSSGALTLDLSNSGTVLVGATAASRDGAFAHAVGAGIFATQATASATTPVAVLGKIDNKGSIKVAANVAGGTSARIVGTGASARPAIAANSKAQATALFIEAGANRATLSNSGLIAVDAITANGDKVTDPTQLASGANALANAILVESAGGGGAGLGVFTIDNSGSIIARVSGDGGKTFRRGTAIDLTSAPNNSVINLLGGGRIVGDIDVRSGDIVNVDQGLTTFNGIVNRACAPGNPLSSSSCGGGTLNITASGNLALVNPALSVPASKDAPASVFVDTLNIAKGGTLTLNLSATDGGTQVPGTYSQIFAKNASIAGKLVANLKFAGGLFANNYFWDNVIDANSLSGSFDSCSASGTGSFLLTFKCINDNAGNVDLSLSRTAFNAVPGLTRNEMSAAGGIDALYKPTLTGPFAALVGQLFNASNATSYAAALNELTGATYAGYLQSFSSLGVDYDNVLDRASECDGPVHSGSILECRTSKVRLWGQIDYQYRKADGDAELSGYHADRHAFLAGIDAVVAPNAVVGMSVGKVDNDVDYRNFFGTIDSSGYQAGLYAVYDPGLFFVKALGTYNWFNGRAHRTLNWAALDPAMALKGTIESHPDVDMYTFGLHGGLRLKTGTASLLIPYVNYDYTHAELGGFAEHGLDGADLTVFGGHDKHSWLTGGVKWTGSIGAVVPSIDVGYRHMFGSRRAAFDAAFLGDKATEFNIISATQKPNAVLAGASIGGRVGRVDVRIAYEGAFNSSYQEHSGLLKAVLPLGGHVMPLAARSVTTPPAPLPPPSAPATQTCADGTTVLATDACPVLPPPPPAPPPVTQGERG